MSWFRIEGRMPHHRKIAPLSDSAFRLHITAGCWSVEERTEGHIPHEIPPTLQGAPRGAGLKKAIDSLVARGAWESVDGGYQIHDFLKYNMSNAQAAAKASAGRAGGKQSGKQRRSKNEASASADAEQVVKQKATTPQAESESESESEILTPQLAPPAVGKTKQIRKRAKRLLPDDWAPNDKHRELAKSLGLDVNWKAQTFRNHADSEGRTSASWNAAFNNWLLQARDAKPIQSQEPDPELKRRQEQCRRNAIANRAERQAELVSGSNAGKPPPDAKNAIAGLLEGIG